MKRKRTRTTELQISSISHIHDPDAARKWMDLYIKLLKDQLIANHTDYDHNGE